MFKKILTALVALSVITPSVALADNRGYRHNHNYNRHHNKNDGDWVVPLLGGLIIGGIIASESNKNRNTTRDDYYNPPRNTQRYPRERCTERWVVEYDRWGERYQYLERVCR